MAKYWLSLAAENDLLNIALYGMEQFGIEQSLTYRDQLLTRFEELSEKPETYPLVKHIRKDYRRSVCGVHSIYYRMTNDGIEIVRILGRQDTARAF